MVVLYLFVLLAAHAAEVSLHDAVYREDLAAVRRLIGSRADVNASTDLGVTPLWLACENGNTEAAGLLLEAGARPDAALLSGETPLMAAARGGFAEVVELLLGMGADPNRRGTRGQTALMWAASRRHAGTVRVLLRYRADWKLRSESWSQMMAVPPHGHPEYNREIPHGGQTALLFAVRSGDVECVRLLLEAGADAKDADAWGVTAVMLAAHGAHTGLVELLLERGADPNAEGPGFTALHAAILHRNERMVAALLRHKADANQRLRTWTPTRRSSRDYHFAPSMVGASPLWLGVRFGSVGIVKLLAEHGADVRFVHRVEYMGSGYRKRREWTPLLHAALGGGSGTAWAPAAAPAAGNREMQALEMVKLLCELGADRGAVDGDGRTAAEVARGLGYRKVEEALRGGTERR